MITGSLSLTTDVNIANMALFSEGKVLMLGEDHVPGLNHNNSVIPATILLPPYPSVMAELDGDLETAYSQYIGFLGSKEPSMFICAVIAALMKNINIVVLLGKTESEMHFVTWLHQYLTCTYGITMKTDTSPFMYNSAYDGVVLSDLYMYDLINYTEFLIRYPYNLNLPKHMIPKLVMEMNPYVENPSEESYTRYFETFKNHIKENNNQILINPLLRG